MKSFLVSLLVVYATGQSLNPLIGQFDITAVEFKRRIDEGFFAAIIDVRSADEFQRGHIENATLIESLASFGTPGQIATPDDLSGCESCDLGIYCQSGGRAGRAIEILTEAGFKGRLYNGQGVSQWTDEDYPLVTGASTPALCATTAEGQQACEMSFLARTGQGNETPATGDGASDGNPDMTGQPLDPFAEEFDVTAVEFKRLIDEGFFAAVIDVRTAQEFQSGHIENATLIESLASFGTSSEITTPSDLSGCESCDLGIYCRVGNRAGQAIEILKTAGFKGRLYNGQGVVQWDDEGYPLVTGASTPALCATTAEGQQACEMSFLARTQGGEMPATGDGMEDDEKTGDDQSTGDTPTAENDVSTGMSASKLKRTLHFITLSAIASLLLAI